MELIVTKNAQAGTAQYLSPHEIHNLVLTCKSLATTKGFYTGVSSVRLINESLPEGLFADFRPALNVIRIDFTQFADRMKHLKLNMAALHLKFLLAHELIHALGMLPAQGGGF